MARKHKRKRRLRKARAQELVEPAIVGLVARIRAASARVVSDRADAEAVHDFRVGLRRLRTVLRTCRPLYGKKKMVAFEARLKAFGNATNALREEEVLEATFVPLNLYERQTRALEAWFAERRSRETELRESAIALIDGPGLEKWLRKLEKLVARAPRRRRRARAFARASLRAVRSGVLERLPVHADDGDALHRLRIRFKRLRYTADMLADLVDGQPAGGKKRATVDYGAIARSAAGMQKILGNLHDADEALATLARTAAVDPELKQSIAAVLKTHRDDLARRAVEAIHLLPRKTLGKKTPGARNPPGSVPTPPSVSQRSGATASGARPAAGNPSAAGNPPVAAAEQATSPDAATPAADPDAA